MQRVVVNTPQPLDPDSKKEQERVLLVFGERLRQLRHDRLMTLEQVAEIADIHWNYLSAVERGKHNVSLFNIWRIASSLGIPANDLMDGLPEGKVKHLVTKSKRPD